ncbi:hypothetical protein WG907_18020 [Sphingobium sp. AN558]|uniref:hypothetical protein n=1 Tax=Sphingobium sp. AN558 TaxID=3133442 RepID=UPI0030C3133B
MIAEIGQQDDCGADRFGDVLPLALDIEHVRLVEIVHLEGDFPKSAEDEAAFQDEVLVDVEAVADGIYLVNEFGDLLTCVLVLPLGRGDGQQQVGIIELGAAAVYADEDIENLVEVLAALQEEVD